MFSKSLALRPSTHLLLLRHDLHPHPVYIDDTTVISEKKIIRLPWIFSKPLALQTSKENFSKSITPGSRSVSTLTIYRRYNSYSCADKTYTTFTHASQLIAFQARKRKSLNLFILLHVLHLQYLYELHNSSFSEYKTCKTFTNTSLTVRLSDFYALFLELYYVSVYVNIHNARYSILCCFIKVKMHLLGKTIVEWMVCLLGNCLNVQSANKVSTTYTYLLIWIRALIYRLTWDITAYIRFTHSYFTDQQVTYTFFATELMMSQ